MGPKTLTVDLGFDDAQQAIADGIGQFCRDRFPEETAKRPIESLSRSLWSELAELGVLALATPEGDGEAVEMVAACEALGRAVFPGPLVHTFMATQLLRVDERIGVASGRILVSVGEPPLMPWASDASLFIALDGERAFMARPTGPIEAVKTLGGEPWGRVSLERERELGGVARGVALYEIALAAYLAAAARQLVEVTSEHARTRRQFGKPIGEFQAVAHPLADCEIHLAAAQTLAREAAFRFDAAAIGTGSLIHAKVRLASSTARLSAASASIESISVCHQLFGAIGISLEGPIYHITRRIRQLVSQRPGEDAARLAVLEHFGTLEPSTEESHV
jgi:alkylation response protein AidB-like acyl-CoA dehydrogenase